MPSLRKAIDEKCKDCTYDKSAPGNWRAQVTLCSCKNCHLWEVRPKTTSAISEAVLSYYGVKPGEFEVDYAELKTGRKDQSTGAHLIAASVDSGCTRNTSADES